MNSKHFSLTFILNARVLKNSEKLRYPLKILLEPKLDAQKANLVMNYVQLLMLSSGSTCLPLPLNILI